MNMYDSIGGAIYYINQIKCVLLYGYFEVYMNRFFVSAFHLVKKLLLACMISYHSGAPLQKQVCLRPSVL